MIYSENKKPVFDLNSEKIKKIFTDRGFAIPSSEIEFLETMRNKKMPVKFISDEIMKAKNWDEDELDEECADKESKLKLFLELYDIIYTTEETQVEKEEEQEKISSEIPQEESSGIPCSQPVVAVDLSEKMTLEEAKEFFGNYRDGMKIENKIKVKSSVFSENMPITVNTDFRVQYTGIDTPVSTKNVFIVDKDCTCVVTVGTLEKQENNNSFLYFTADRNSIDYDMYENQSAFNIVLLEINGDGSPTGKMYYKEVKINMHQIESTDSILCIDFGTSNTTVGSYRIKNRYGNSPELVEFVDVTHSNKMMSCCPTMAYVKDCSDEDNIVYQFGYNAKRMERRCRYESKASVFYQLKHWLQEDSSFRSTIDITDENGNIREVQKKEIVKAYLLFIIEQSQEYFNVKFHKLHFTAPVKMKSKFISELKKLLEPQYEIMSEKEGIDEAGAIIFDYVSEKFESYRGEEEHEGSVVIVDCGGGTTDLAECDYYFGRYNSLGQRELKIVTKFSNGNSGFGGNNITYKLMQLIKIKLALKNGFIDQKEYDSIFSDSENKMLIEIDDGKAVYNELQALYNRCEEFLPTKFADKELWWDETENIQVKRNFYYLWHYAEQVKIMFYREEKVVLYENRNDKIEIVGDDNCNYLYYNQNNGFEKTEHPFDNLTITITEIRKIIYGDIYKLLIDILPENPDSPEHYRLSGQSCKINLFTELLKEFIPGKKLREKMSEYSEQQESLKLKLRCINGSIRYMMYKYKNIGAEVFTENGLSGQIYNVFVKNIDGVEISVMEEKIIKYIPVKSDLDEIIFSVKNRHGDEMRQFSVNSKTKGMKFFYYADDLKAMFNKLKKENNEVNWAESQRKLANYGESAYFVVAVPAGRNDGYGFCVYFIQKKVDATGQKYALSEPRYYNYENTDISYFDGER
ncbi:MAG: hypothetical protein K2I06_08505 [Ruminococcus sp.]|nr:hypothetical protein [Ruminococcus sp.]